MPIDADLLARLVDRYLPALVLLARQRCQAAEDVVQEAFLKLAAQRTAPVAAGAWLFTVVRRGAISQARKERRRRQHEADAASQAPACFAPDPANALMAAEATAALAQLPAEQREIVVAHLWGGLTFQEVATVMGTSSSSAHRNYQEGLARLRRLLEASCPSLTLNH